MQDTGRGGKEVFFRDVREAGRTPKDRQKTGKPRSPSSTFYHLVNS